MRAFLIVGTAFSAGLLGGMTTTLAAAAKAAENPYDGLDTLARALTTIEMHFVEERPTRQLVDGAIRGMVGELDPHSTYLDPEAYDEMRTDTEGEVIGIGVVMVPRDGRVLVARVISGGPAALAGIQAGDFLVGIAGQAPSSVEQASALLSGPRGEPVEIVVQRGAKELTMRPVRDRIVDPGVWSDRRDDVAYVRIERFRRGVASGVADQLTELEEQGPLSAVVLDVRDNPGGLLEEAVGVVDLFVSQGLVVSTQDRGATVESRAASADPTDRAQRLVVLVNESSASAAEIVAGAIQLLGRGTIVGTTSYGKGSVQQLFEFEDASALKLTVARYTLLDGTIIDGAGVTPDISVAPTTEDGGEALRTRLAGLAIDEAERSELLAMVDALADDAPRGAVIDWTGSLETRLAQDPQLKAAWQAATAR